MRAVNGAVVFASAVALAFVFGALIIRETVYCSVGHAGESDANGYYSALNGVYWKHGSSPSFYFPDFFGVVALHRDTSSMMTMALVKHAWIMARGSQVLYINSPPAAEANKYIDSPPLLGWGWGDDVEKTPVDGIAPVVNYCVGSLQDSPTLAPPTPASAQSGGMKDVLQSPATSLLLFGISLYAMYLWAQRVEPASVAYSYDAVVGRGQYWRMLTASFAHFEPLHWLFNTVSLFQLGFLESVYGSAEYAYLSLDLVLVTMGICVTMDHILIHRYNMTDVAQRTAVGYSCVLFAWMVAASVRMKTFCPIFLFPSFCFDTHNIPLIGLPVNAGPIILLIVTKIVIPQSSFLGHLSGIVIGYPLAWNWLDWLTPPIFSALLATLYTCGKQLFVWRYPGFEQASAPLQDFVPAPSLAWIWRLQMSVWLSAALAITTIFVFGPLSALPRLVLAFSAWSTLQSRRCAFITDMHNVIEDSASHAILLLVLAAALALCDAATCGVYSTSWALVSSYAQPSADTDSSTATALALALCAACLLLELVLCVVTLSIAHDVPSAATLLASTGLGPGVFGFVTTAYHRMAAAATGPFAGRANRLDGVGVGVGVGGGGVASDVVFDGSTVEIAALHQAGPPAKTIAL